MSSRQTKFMHRHLPTGHSVTIGYSFADNHVGEVWVAFSFKSPKDLFSKKDAHTVIRKAFAEGDYITVMQNNDKHIIDIVVDTFNETGCKLAPESWKKFFPEGVRLCKTVTLEPISITHRAANDFIAEAMNDAISIKNNVVEDLIHAKMKREIEKANRKPREISPEKQKRHEERKAAWEAKQAK